MKTLNLTRPTAQSTHAEVAALRLAVDEAHRHNQWLTEAEMEAKANRLGLELLSREVNNRATNCIYGLHRTGTHTEEAFFHVCFVTISNTGKAGRVATFLTIFTNPLARGGWDIDPLTGRDNQPHPFGENTLEDICHG